MAYTLPKGWEDTLKDYVPEGNFTIPSNPTAPTIDKQAEYLETISNNSAAQTPTVPQTTPTGTTPNGTTPNGTTPPPNMQTEQPSAIKTAYDSYIEQLQGQQLNSKNEAYIAQERAKSYIGNLLKSQGYGGTGLAQSTQLGLTGQYQRALSGANQQYSQGVQQAEENKLVMQQEQENKIMGGLQDSISQGNLSKEQIDELANQYRGSLSPENQQILDIYIESAKKGTGTITPAMEQQAIEEAKGQGYASNEDIADYIEQTYGITQEQKENIAQGNVKSTATTQALEQWNPTITGKSSFEASTDNTTINREWRKVADVVYGNKKVTETDSSFIKSWLVLGAQGKIPDGAVVDMNYGNYNKWFVYVDGKFYNITTKEAKAKGATFYKTQEDLNK